MSRNETLIHSDPEIMGDTPVFVGTRVPLATLKRELVGYEARTAPEMGWASKTFRRST